MRSKAGHHIHKI